MSYPELLKKDYDKYIKEWLDHYRYLTEREWDECYDIVMRKSGKKGYDDAMSIHERTVFDKMKALPRDSLILDVGCGNSYFLYQLHKAGFTKLYGTDCIRYAIEISIRGFVEKGVKEYTFCKSNAERLPFNDNMFDVVLSIEVLEHVQDATRALREMWRTLKSGGRLLATVPKDNLVWSWCHVNYFSTEGDALPKGARANINFYNLNELLKSLSFCDIEIETLDSDEVKGDKMFVISARKK